MFVADGHSGSRPRSWYKFSRERTGNGRFHSTNAFSYHYQHWSSVIFQLAKICSTPNEIWSCDIIEQLLHYKTSGVLKNLGSPWITPTPPFFPKFLGSFVRMDAVNIHAKLELRSSTRSWDNRGYWTNYVMTSPLTSRCQHRLSVWIVWTHCAADDFVKIWSKNCRRYSMLKVVCPDCDVIGSRDIIGEVTIT